MKYFSRILLMPFSVVFYLVVKFRNFCYYYSIFKSYKMSAPVVSVGNISTGGTGKTPLTIFIADFFLNKGLKVGIVSRGYGRNTTGAVPVFIGGQFRCSVNDSGDELYMIALKFEQHKNKKNLYIVASESRIDAVEFLIHNFNIDIVVLDDGFQHRKIARDLDIVIMTKAKNLFDKILLPAGNLRETVSRAVQNSVIVLNKKSDDNFEPNIIEAASQTVSMKYIVDNFRNYEGGLFKGGKCAVMCGIADPASFIDLIGKKKIVIENKFIFKDHHNFSGEELVRISEKYKGCILTTEKDFTKIIAIELPEELKRRIYFAELELKFDKNYYILENELNKMIRKED